jgi:hypothetical protein
MRCPCRSHQSPDGVGAPVAHEGHAGGHPSLSDDRFDPTSAAVNGRPQRPAIEEAQQPFNDLDLN